MKQIVIPSKLANTGKLAEPATEAQKNWLRTMGCDMSKSYTKADAANIIADSPANERQKKYLEERGYDVSNLTIGQFQATITFLQNERSEK